MHGRRLRVGDLVRIRGERWRVATESADDAVSFVDVDGAEIANQGIRTRFILPFETLEPSRPPATTPRVGTFRRWQRVARACVAAATPRWTSLRAAARANLTIIPFQLEPVLAVLRGDGCRILIADDVGLGKTIQAGLIVAETLSRTPDGRVLIVSPAGLREQWDEELRLRFSLEPHMLDAGGIARSIAHLSPDVNPWTMHPIAITSVDFVKRPDVMRSLETLVWDVVVLDEAHTLAGRSDRAAAAAALARRARCLVMLTATPHSGDDDAFERLKTLGDLGGAFPLIAFRRSRGDVGLPHGRRSILMRVRQTPAETALHRALAEYVALLRQAAEGDAGPAVALVASILARRACSSAGSLARSLERRMRRLADAPTPRGDQLLLPFELDEYDDEPDAELGAPALRDEGEERAWLEKLLSLASRASAVESKIRVLRRFLARANEPALVFTEYRDTLQLLAERLGEFEPLQLHGGLTPSERRLVLRRFTAHGARLLLATDAASEGLNLHHRCRLIVNLEVPWTPVRLEQRIGRLDRLGQARRVHAVQLIATGSYEEAIAERLVTRTARIRAVLDGPSEAFAPGPSTLPVDAQTESSRLTVARLMARTDGNDPAVAGRPILTFVRSLGRSKGTIWGIRVSCADTSGHVVFETIIGVRDARHRRTLDGALESASFEGHQRVLTELMASLQPSLRLFTRREEAILESLRDFHARLSAGLLQPGLFDRRADRAAAAQASLLAQATRDCSTTLAQLHRLGDLHAGGQTLLFGIAFHR